MSKNNKKDYFIPLAMGLIGLCVIFGAINLWEVIFPPKMTPYCAYLLNTYPTDKLDSLNESTKESINDCLYLQKRYGQKLWVPKN
jgi:hypothetical protein